jgi:hypothetical protein
MSAENVPHARRHERSDPGKHQLQLFESIMTKSLFFTFWRRWSIMTRLLIGFTVTLSPLALAFSMISLQSESASSALGASTPTSTIPPAT